MGSLERNPEGFSIEDFEQFKAFGMGGRVKGFFYVGSGTVYRVM